MTLVVGSVVQLRASRDGGGASHSELAKAGIVWKVAGDQVLWVPIANSRGDGQALHRADIRVTDMGVHTAAGFPVPRPVIECRKLIRWALAMFEGRPVLGNVPPALMAEIAAMQLREARQLVAETRLENIYQRPNPPRGARSTIAGKRRSAGWPRSAGRASAARPGRTICARPHDPARHRAPPGRAVGHGRP